MTDKILAAQAKQRSVCLQTYLRENVPQWAIDQCMLKCDRLIQDISRAWQAKDKEAYELALNALSEYLKVSSKNSWHSVPPPLPRREDEPVEKWVDRMYRAWR